ncbi:hypothetical protein [Eubacterium sp.]
MSTFPFSLYVSDVPFTAVSSSFQSEFEYVKDLEFFMFLSSGSVSARSGYCQAWIADVYQAVTGSRGSAHCVLCAADMWAV